MTTVTTTTSPPLRTNRHGGCYEEGAAYSLEKKAEVLRIYREIKAELGRTKPAMNGGVPWSRLGSLSFNVGVHVEHLLSYRNLERLRPLSCAAQTVPCAGGSL
jgi:hypothetical protein